MTGASTQLVLPNSWGSHIAGLPDSWGYHIPGAPTQEELPHGWGSHLNGVAGASKLLETGDCWVQLMHTYRLRSQSKVILVILDKTLHQFCMKFTLWFAKVKNSKDM